jgi:hypothetical protein
VQIWILKQGWLSKRASGRMTSGHWQRRWFVLQSDGSLYHLSSRNGEDRKAVANLHISTIKTDVKEKERASFCLVSPTHSYCLLADNELERQEWINSIQVWAADFGDCLLCWSPFCLTGALQIRSILRVWKEASGHLLGFVSLLIGNSQRLEEYLLPLNEQSNARSPQRHEGCRLLYTPFCAKANCLHA